MVNGNIVVVAEEEGFSLNKPAINSFTYNAIRYCLSKAEVFIDDISCVGIGFDYRKIQSDIKNLSSDALLVLYLPRLLFKYPKKPKLVFVNHHLTHIYSAR